MSKENIRLIKFFGVIFLAVVLSYKLPHDSYSFIQYIIKPIKYENGIIYLSGVIPLILILIGIKGILKLERFKEKNKILIVLIILIFIIPLMKWTIDFARTNYHWIKNDGINSIDINESDIGLSISNDSTIIHIRLKLKNYNRRHNEFRIRVYLPKSLSEYTGKEYYEFENLYEMYGNYILNVNEQIVIDTKNADKLDNLFDMYWYYEDLKYELYNDNKTVDIIKHGY